MYSFPPKCLHADHLDSFEIDGTYCTTSVLDTAIVAKWDFNNEIANMTAYYKRDNNLLLLDRDEEKGPALIRLYADGRKAHCWYKNGVPHRRFGSAIILYDEEGRISHTTNMRDGRILSDRHLPTTTRYIYNNNDVYTVHKWITPLYQLGRGNSKSGLAVVVRKNGKVIEEQLYENNQYVRSVFY